MQTLAGKVAVITGASRGMGRHFVAALVAAGARIACLARPSDELVSLIPEFGDAVLPLACDVRDASAVAAAIAHTIEKWGRIDFVIANAGIFHPFAFEHASDEIIRRHVETNILGVSWLIRAAIPYLRATKGQIIAISSESVLFPFPMLALYAASKAAVETLCEGLRAELRDDGIRVTVLRSGSVNGGSGSRDWSAETTQAFYRKIVATGHATMSGNSATPESMAASLLAIMSLPPDVSADLVVVRAARSGIPESARQATH